ncbi:protein of unknown function [Noviherbaspirillum humi]|uniref:Cobalt/nickel transport protein n=1 Tax=Noviherbaspirillum humi TaxID=1688639 RepID=A0A239I4E0_9BURK|nr:DUF4198 domain-containing protein [Noviherbaspirillum humi]SNS88467.1 protein of unknown function [Noviherbaspirillum humi]
MQIRLTAVPALASLLLGLMLAAPAAVAHEFWMSSLPGPAGSARLQLLVGEYFEGSRVGFTREHAAAMRHYTGAGVEDLLPRLPRDGMLEALALPALRPGMHLIAYDSHPSLITLPAGRFHAYLHDEGLDAIVRWREEHGLADRPGRERFRRHVKHLICVGDAGAMNSQVHAVGTGQRLEILPRFQAGDLRPGADLPLAVSFDGRPLAGALLKAWHRRSGQTTLIRAHTDGQGQATIDLPYAGEWMFSVVHMIPAEGTADADWDSFWGNLTLTVREGGCR